MQFVVMGRVNRDYALVYSAASMVASVLGVVVIGDAVRRTGRTSLVVFSLAAVMLIGCLAVGVFGGLGIAQSIREGNTDMQPLCD